MLQHNESLTMTLTLAQHNFVQMAQVARCCPLLEVLTLHLLSGSGQRQAMPWLARGLWDLLHNKTAQLQQEQQQLKHVLVLSGSSFQLFMGMLMCRSDFKQA